MNIRELSKKVNNDLGLRDYRGTLKIITYTFKLMRKTLIFGEEIKVKDFFTFRLKKKSSRKGWDFEKSEVIDIEPRFTPEAKFGINVINQIKKKPIYDPKKES